MKKKQVLLGIVIAAAVAAALDYGLFMVWGLRYLAKPADFKYADTSNSFVIVHYQFNWIHYLIEAILIFVLFTLIVAWRSRRKRRGRIKSD